MGRATRCLRERCALASRVAQCKVGRGQQAGMDGGSSTQQRRAPASPGLALAAPSPPRLPGPAARQGPVPQGPASPPSPRQRRLATSRVSCRCPQGWGAGQAALDAEAAEEQPHTLPQDSGLPPPGRSSPSGRGARRPTVAGVPFRTATWPPPPGSHGLGNGSLTPPAASQPRRLLSVQQDGGHLSPSSAPSQKAALRP